jgi:predicted dehydrogenase
LEKEELDVVSNCTWTKLHTPIVVEAAASGVRAIHSEKPVATSWGDAKKQHRAAVENEVQLTYCH